MNQQPMNTAPVAQLKTNRSALKLVLLGLITFGIYPIVSIANMSSDLNQVAGRYDGKRTMNFCLLTFLVGPLTLGIGVFVWFHRFSARMGRELTRRGIGYAFGALSYWGWNVLGSMILVGPFIYQHKMCKAMNLLNSDYNLRG